MSEVNNETQQSLSFTTVEWKKGMIITAADLNRFEEGILNLTNNANTTNDTIANLDYSDSSAANTKFVSQVTETDGQIAVTHRDFAPSISIVAATSEQGENNSDKPRITFSVGGNPATSGDINTATTGVYGVTKLSNAIDSDSEVLAATPKAVKDALTTANTSLTNTINGLNGGVITNSPSTSNTLTALSESAGQISATFAPISITTSQISDRGSANGVATLDASSKVPSSQLPSYVDDILEGTAGTPVEGKVTVFNDLNNEPYTPESGKIYVDTTSNMSYRYAGSASGYVKVASDLTLGETDATAYRGDRGKTAYDHASDANRITTAQSTAKLYKITATAQGHIGSLTAATLSDITNLGVPEAADAVVEKLRVGTGPVITGTYSAYVGIDSIVSGNGSFASGETCTASGNISFVQGSLSQATGDYSHAMGQGVVASANNQSVIGKYNVENNISEVPAWNSKTAYVIGNIVKLTETNVNTNTTETYYYKCVGANTGRMPPQYPYWISTDYKDLIEIVGNGTATNARSNARALDKDGNEYLKGNLYIQCSEDSTGGILIGGTTVNNEKAVQFSDGTTTVTFTMSELAALKALLNS